jgi:hypothetical protein
VSPGKSCRRPGSRVRSGVREDHRMFWVHVLLIAAGIGLIAGYAVRPSAPEESWGHALACLVPLSLIAGFVLTVAGSA